MEMVTNAMIPLSTSEIARNKLDSNVNAYYDNWNDEMFTSELLDLLSSPPPSPTGTTRKKVVKSSSSRDVKKITSDTTQKPIPCLKLYSFPSFDKSSSTIYFASTYARLLNSGELKKLSRVIKSHCAQDCEVKLHETLKVSLGTYMDMLSILNVLNPDSVYCMHSTRVVENQIKSVLYFKYTDVPEMYTYADTVVTDPAYKWVYVGKRRNILRRNLELDSQAQDKQRDIYALVEKEEELQVYGKMLLTLTFDQYSKKILHVDYDSKNTSVYHNNMHITLDA